MMRMDSPSGSARIVFRFTSATWPRLMRRALILCVSLTPLCYGVDGDADDIAAITIEVGTTSLPLHAQGWFQSEVRSFMKAHPGIEIKTSALSAPVRPFGARIRELPRLAADVIGVRAGCYEDEIYYLVSNELIVPIEEFLPDPEFSLENYYESSLSTVRLEGKTWGVPLIADTFYLVMDKELLAKAGITKPPETWEELKGYASRLTRDTDGDGRTDEFGLYIPQGIGIELMMTFSIAIQRGFRIEQNGNIDFNQPELKEAFAMTHEIVASPYTDTSIIPTFGVPSDRRPRSAMALFSNMHQHLPQISERMRAISKDDRYAIAPLPTAGDNVYFMGTRLYLAVRKSTPEKMAASWQFIKWMNRDDMRYTDFWFGHPWRKDVLDTPRFNDWAETQNEGLKSVMASVEGSTNVGRQLHVGAGPQLHIILQPYFQSKVGIGEILPGLQSRGDTFFLPAPSLVKENELFR